MAKAIIRFSFPGNIVWGDTIQDNWASLLVNYIKEELTIGNGTFISAELCLNGGHNQNPVLTGHMPPKRIITEILCDIPKSIVNDEFDLRARLITLLEDREFDFIKFHNCGPEGNISLGTNRSMKPQGI